MAFPKSTEEINNTPLNYDKDLNDLDALLAEQSIPRQSFSKPDPATPKTEFPAAGKPGLNISPEYDAKGNEPIDFAEQDRKRKAAFSNAKITAEMIDHGLGTVGQLIAKNESSKGYKADTNELATLSDAWAGVVADYDFNIPPWVQLVILYPAIYMPKMMKAVNDGRIVRMQLKQEEQEKRIQSLEENQKKTDDKH